MSDRPLILFAPGAGAPSTSAWMLAWAERLATLGEVVAFDYPYRRAGRKLPDRLPTLIAAHAEALDEARARHGRERPVVLAGKSMGSRVGCHLAVQLADEGRGPAGLVCFGYPLRAGRTGALRDAVLVQLRTPVLFLQGTRDPLCPLDDLASVRARMTAPSDLLVVEGGDHSLEVPVRQRAQGAGDPAVVLAAIARFLSPLASP